MPANKNALIRYKTLDKCFRNRQRRWTLNMLIEACSDALYEFEGRAVDLSKRTVQGDIQMMRSEKLGYNAPIEVYEKKYYRYADPDYSITQSPIRDTDMQSLSEAVALLKEFKDFSLFKELNSAIHRLTDTIDAEKNKRKPIIHFDKNEQLKGIENLDVLYQATLNKMPLKLTYQSFKAQQPAAFVFHPYLLKQFNNRWFCFGAKGQAQNVTNLALDRMLHIAPSPNSTFHAIPFNPETYFADTIGVTVINSPPEIITFSIDAKNAPYVITKPFHPSQEILETLDDGTVVFQIRVHINFELERKFLGFGRYLTVLSPVSLQKSLIRHFNSAIESYNKNPFFKG